MGSFVHLHFEASKKAQSIESEENSVSGQFMLLQDSQIQDLKQTFLSTVHSTG